MRTYSDFRPTAMDRHINIDGDESREDWLVAPVTQTRDSERLERSNFRVVLADFKRIDPEGNDWELHRFGHWGPGWFEVLIVRPDTPVAAAAEDWESALANYPVADENDLGELEFEEVSAQWDCTPYQRARLIREYNESLRGANAYAVSLFAARRDEIPERLWEYLSREH